MEWHFTKYHKGDTIRDTISGEFFSVDAIKNSSDALVREGIQNALDAQVEEKIGVKIRLFTGSQAPSKKVILKWFNGAWEHLCVPNNGLFPGWDEENKCPVLVFEDFGTMGLQGDVEQPFEISGRQNHFFYFFRSEGISAKSGENIGRWGVGKHVFPRSSNIKTCFGLTVRSDDRQKLMMGRTILKSHELNNLHYTPDGYLGEQAKDSELILPVTNHECLSSFCNEFGISRKNEPGLSIVIPYLDSKINYEDIMNAVISGFFYPILTGRLVVEITSPTDKTTINKQSILDETAFAENSEMENSFPTIKLAEWAITQSISDEYRLLPCTETHLNWNNELIQERDYLKMRDDFENGRMMKVVARINIEKEGNPPVLSSFEVYLSRDGSESGKTIFIRDGIIISDVKSPRTRGIRSIVIVNDKPLATLLGDSENPAHTEWHIVTPNFSKKYKNGKYCIKFVTQIVYNLFNSLGAQEEQEDLNLLIDIFSLPAEETEESLEEPVSVGGGEPGKISGGVIGPVQSEEKKFQISMIRGGFKISPGKSEIKYPAKMDVKVAYDTRRGNPLNKYRPYDFLLEKEPIKYKDLLRGITIKSVNDNNIVAEVREPDFQMVVAGFDEKRDLFVKVTVREVSDDSEI